MGSSASLATPTLITEKISHRIREVFWRAWARMPRASQVALIAPHTMLPRERLIALERAVCDIVRRQVPGDVVECGSAEGGSAALLALWLRRFRSNKRIFVFDTFEGLPPPTFQDPDYDEAVPWTGKCRGDLEHVQELFKQLGVLDRAVFVKGKFQDTLPTYNIPAIALLHLDCDWYDSTMTCLQHLWDHLSPGGILVIDDYSDWQGCRRAVEEFFESRRITDRKHFVEGACWLMKSRN